MADSLRPDLAKGLIEYLCEFVYAANVLPKDIQWLAKAVMIEHMSNVAVKHLRDMQLNSNDLAVLARVFSSRLVDEVQEELKDE